jgi:hypothetical protein
MNRTGQAEQDKLQQDRARRSGKDETSSTRQAHQDRTGRAGQDAEQDKTGRAKVSRSDDFDLDLVASFELKTNQSDSGFI